MGPSILLTAYSGRNGASRLRADEFGSEKYDRDDPEVGESDVGGRAADCNNAALRFCGTVAGGVEGIALETFGLTSKRGGVLEFVGVTGGEGLPPEEYVPGKPREFCFINGSLNFIFTKYA